MHQYGKYKMCAMLEMQFVIKNNIDKRGAFVGNEIVAHAATDNADILNNIAVAFAKSHGGNESIIDVHSLDQIAEPLTDTMLLYRIMDAPNQIHAYQRISEQVSGYIYGQSTVTEFIKINVFELVKYDIERINIANIETEIAQLESEIAQIDIQQAVQIIRESTHLVPLNL